MLKLQEKHILDIDPVVPLNNKLVKTRTQFQKENVISLFVHFK